MQITSEQLRQISIFRELNPEQLLQLHPHAMVQYYSQGEIILHEGDSRSGRLRQRLPAKLFAVFRGVTQIKKTILRTLPAGEIFAAPALFGDGISPATVVADRNGKIFLSGTCLSNDFAVDFRYLWVWVQSENGWQILGGSVSTIG